jgi:hypothetical protein
MACIACNITSIGFFPFVIHSTGLGTFGTQTGVQANRPGRAACQTASARRGPGAKGEGLCARGRC